jgi:hypothetical protein
MIIFIALILCSILAGTSITYLLKINLYFSERLLYGTIVALSAFIQIIYIMTFYFGFKTLNIVLPLVVIGIISLFLIRELYKKKEIVKFDLNIAFSDLKSLDKLHLPIIMLFWLLIFANVFGKNLFATQDGLLSNSSTDITVHVAFINSFVWGDNFPQMTPLYSGATLVYPFLSDYFSAFLIVCGMNPIFSLSFPAVILCTMFVGILYFFTLHLTKSKIAAAMSPFLVLLGGGFGFWKFFDIDLPQNGYNFIKTMNDAPNLYTDLDQYNIQFFNFIIGYLIPQRSFLFGFPIAITILTLVWLGIERKRKEELFLAGFLGGIFPLFHFHSFMSVSIIIGFLIILFMEKDRAYFKRWIYFFVPLLIFSLPQIFYIMSRVSTSSFVFKPYYGWLAHDNNYAWFWLKNTGFLFFLVIDALLSKDVSKDLKKLYVPLIFLFIITNLISFSPCWIGDNAKIILFWFIGSIPFVAISLINLFKRSKVTAIVIFLTFTFSGMLDITKSVITTKRVFQVWNNKDLNIAKAIREKTLPHDIFFNAPVHYSPIFLTGRTTLMGDPMHVCSQGINMNRETEIKQVFELKDTKLQLAYLKNLGADYALIGPTEKEKLKDKTLFEKNFPVFIDQGEYKVYKLKE